MAEQKVLLHYDLHENVEDEWLVISIPDDRAGFAKEIVDLIADYLQKPLTYKEKDDAYGDFIVILENRLAVLRGLTGCTLRTEKTADTVVHIHF